MKVRQVLIAIMEEPELPGIIPDKLTELIRTAIANNNTEMIEELLRVVVRKTKEGIAERIIYMEEKSN